MQSITDSDSGMLGRPGKPGKQRNYARSPSARFSPSKYSFSAATASIARGHANPSRKYRQGSRHYRALQTPFPPGRLPGPRHGGIGKLFVLPGVFKNNIAIVGILYKTVGRGSLPDEIISAQGQLFALRAAIVVVRSYIASVTR